MDSDDDDAKRIAKLVLDFRRIGQMVLDHRGVDADDHQHLISLLFAGTNGGEKRPRPRGTREEREELEELQAPRRRRRLVTQVVSEFTLEYMESIESLPLAHRRQLLAFVMQPRFLPASAPRLHVDLGDQQRIVAAIKEVHRLTITYNLIDQMMEEGLLADDWRQVFHHLDFVGDVFAAWFSIQPADFRVGSVRAVGSGLAPAEAKKAGKRAAARYGTAVGGNQAWSGWYGSFLGNAIVNWHISESYRSVWSHALKGVENPDVFRMWPGAYSMYRYGTADVNIFEMSFFRIEVLGVSGAAGKRGVEGVSIAGGEAQPSGYIFTLRETAIRKVWMDFGKLVLEAARDTRLVLRIPSLLWPKALATEVTASMKQNEVTESMKLGPHRMKQNDVSLSIQAKRKHYPYVLFESPMRVVGPPSLVGSDPMLYSLSMLHTAPIFQLRLQNVVVLDAMNATKMFSSVVKGSTFMPRDMRFETGWRFELTGDMSFSEDQGGPLILVAHDYERPRVAFKGEYRADDVVPFRLLRKRGWTRGGVLPMTARDPSAPLPPWLQRVSSAQYIPTKASKETTPNGEEDPMVVGRKGRFWDALFL